jgi:hypothetical protein
VRTDPAACAGIARRGGHVPTLNTDPGIVSELLDVAFSLRSAAEITRDLVEACGTRLVELGQLAGRDGAVSSRRRERA